MQFASIRLVTADINRLVAFYETLTGVIALRPTPQFAMLNFGAVQLALSDEAMIQRFNADVASAAPNPGLIVEFEVADVDAALAKLDPAVALVMQPADMPWGNRSMLLRDPDGNAVNIFARAAA